nr:SDR family oxidoreductase [Streptomyces hoynatensis]
MAQPLNGKAAVVTGGSRGIGRAIVERLARDGAQVVFSYAKNQARAAEVEAAVAAAGGGTARGVRADFTEPAQAEALMERAAELLGGLDVLVNNAVRDISLTPLADTPDELWEETMAANATSVFVTLRYAARHMRDNGRIVNISTLNTSRPGPGLGLYVAGKGALEQLTAVAAVELGPRGITANVVSPGATDTELFRTHNPPEAVAQVERLTPLGRLGEPADIADVVAFLAGPDGRWLTGQNLHATGGFG